MENNQTREMISMDEAISVFLPQIDRLRMTVSVLHAKNQVLKNNLDGFLNMNRSVQQELYCTACGSFFQGKVFMCTNGHNFCVSCHLRVNQCPGCLDDGPRANNAFMEGLIGKVSYPCSYSPEGCPAFFVHVDNQQRVDHEMTCGFKFACKFYVKYHTTNIEAPCEWSGKTADFFQHCLEFHSHEIMNGDFGCIVNIAPKENVISPSYITSFLIKCLGNKLFIVRFLLQQEADILVPHAFYVGDSAEINQFRVSYRFSRPNYEMIYTAAPLPSLRNTNVCALLQSHHHISNNSLSMFIGPEGIACHISVYRTE